MHCTATNLGTKRRANISNARPRFRSRKSAASAIRSALTTAVLAALLAIARPAQAQTETVLYNFAGGSNAANPESLLTSDSAGNFYGTTLYGGLGYGTVFKLSPNGTGGWNETVLHRFTGGLDGEYPQHSNVIFDSLGNLYGTAAGGGRYGGGVVFELRPAATSWTETTLYAFTGGTDGVAPRGCLIMSPAGNLYGTFGGGRYTAHFGGVFELSPSGGNWVENVIYSGSTSNLTAPGVTMDAMGNIFGVVSSKVVELSPDGSGGWNPAVLLTFTSNLAEVDTPVLDQAGKLYGMTALGGAHGCGKVYQLKKGNTGTWTGKNLYSFQCPSQSGYNGDGYYPLGSLVLDTGGNIYGTTNKGGVSDEGTIFELAAPVGTGSYVEKILWSFNGAKGGLPSDGLILDSAGHFYGTTSYGGSHGYGVVFKVTP